jgi:hypothetical protein
MFDPHKKSTGTDYTTTVALLSVAIMISAAMLYVSRPVSLLSISVAAGFSAACVWLAWRNWKKSSRLTIPSCH